MKRGNAQAVMPSYNEIDGVPSHANRWLLQRRAARRDGLQRRGRQRLLRHPGARATVHHVDDRSSSAPAVRALKAGVDIDMPDGDVLRACCRAPLAQGSSRRREIDAAVRRMLRLKFLAGLFEHP